MMDEQLRRLEGEMSERADLLGRLVERFGPEVLDVVTASVDLPRAETALASADLARRDLEAVMGLLWDRMGEQARFEVVERTPRRLSLRVTRCVFADGMRALGAPEIGLACYCAYDAGFCRGLNPEIRFTRQRTLMQG